MESVLIENMTFSGADGSNPMHLRLAIVLAARSVHEILRSSKMPTGDTNLNCNAIPMDRISEILCKTVVCANGE